MSDTTTANVSASGLTPFVILGEPRTGSNLLAGLLSSREDVLSVGELFNPSEDIRRQNVIRAIRKRENPASYLAEKLYGNNGKTAAGFRFFYQHAESWPDVCLYLRDINAHIIHLVRDNAVARYVSERFARLTGEWVLPSGAPVGVEPQSEITIDPDRLIASLMASKHLQEVYRDWFGENPLLEVSFESLVADVEGHAHDIQQFLGLPMTRLNPTTSRQSTGDKLSLVSNLEEVKCAVESAISAGIAPADWRRYFDPSHHVE